MVDRHLSGHDTRRPVPAQFGAVVIALLAAWPIAATAEQGCKPIRFARGHTSTEVSGVVPGHGREGAVGMLCYTLAVADGQKAAIRVLSGDNVAVTSPGVGDARDRFEFVTRRGTYELQVFQLLPGGAGVPFRMRVEVVD